MTDLGICVCLFARLFACLLVYLCVCFWFLLPRNGYSHCLGPNKNRRHCKWQISKVLSLQLFLSFCLCLFIFFFVCFVDDQTTKTIMNISKTNVQYVLEVEWLLVVLFRLSLCTTKWPTKQPSQTNDPQNAPIKISARSLVYAPKFQNYWFFVIWITEPVVCFLICFATPDLRNHVNRRGNMTNKIQKLINLNFESVRFKRGR